MINSAMFTGMDNKQAIEKIIDYLEEKGIGKKAINYKLRRLAYFKTEDTGNAYTYDLLRALRLGA